MRFLEFNRNETSFACILIPLGHGRQLGPVFQNGVIALGTVGEQAGGTVLNALRRIGELPAAFAAKGVEGAVAEQTVELFRVGTGMTGEIFTLCVGEKAIMLCLIHSMLLFSTLLTLLF